MNNHIPDTSQHHGLLKVTDVFIEDRSVWVAGDDSFGKHHGKLMLDISMQPFTIPQIGDVVVFKSTLGFREVAGTVSSATARMNAELQPGDSIMPGGGKIYVGDGTDYLVSKDTVVPPGTVILNASSVVPDSWLLCNGTAYNRSDLPDLFNALTFTLTGTLNSTTTVSGLSSTSAIKTSMKVEGNGISAGTTVSTIVNSTSVTLSAAATLTTTSLLRFFLWGNGDGSTTFNVPNLSSATNATYIIKS